MQESQHIRPTAVAGRFYPADKQQLREVVAGFLQRGREALQNLQPELQPSLGAGHVRAVLAPHAGYAFSGALAGIAFAAAARTAAAADRADAAPRTPERILLAGPAHYHAFEGIALPAAEAFSNPLGQLPLDTAAVARIQQRCGTAVILPEAHAPEHSLEVMLPFLQILWEGIPLVPLLCGRVSPETVAEVLDAEMRPGDLLVVSSDLSHFHTAEQAEAMDLRLLAALEAGDQQGVAAGEACGIIPLLAALQLGEKRGWNRRVLGYAHSGSVSGDMDRVVGYGAAAFSAAEPAAEAAARGDGA